MTKPIIINSHGDELHPAPAPRSRLAVNESVWLARRRMGSALGQSFGGERDLYDALGYKRNLTSSDYLNVYRRNIIGKRLIKKPPASTWQKPPIISDGNEATSDEKPKSEFIKTLQAIIKKHRLWNYLERADRLARLGQYGVLLIGVRDGKALDEPLDGALALNSEISLPINVNIKLSTGPESILYLMPRSEDRAQIANYDSDPQSNRFGLPEFYNITIGELSGTGTRRVHYSRVIHIAENKDDDEVLSSPALEAAMNRLEDLEKVIGGASEAFWLLVRKGLIMLADDNSDFDNDVDGSPEAQRSEQRTDEFLHNVTRILTVSGIKDVKDLGSETPDPSGMFDVLIAQFAADADMPQAMLVGTQKNGLGGDASAEADHKMWSNTIEGRRNNFAQPDILTPVIEFFIRYGILPPPVNGEWTCKWEPLYTPGPKEQGEVAKLNAEAIKTYAEAAQIGADLVTMPGEVFSERFLDYVPETNFEPGELMDLLTPPPAPPPIVPLALPPALPPPPVPPVAANHKGVLVDIPCPFCQARQVMRFEGHGNVTVCPNCEKSFDPAYHYGMGVALNGKH